MTIYINVLPIKKRGQQIIKYFFIIYLKIKMINDYKYI